MRQPPLVLLALTLLSSLAACRVGGAGPDSAATVHDESRAGMPAVEAAEVDHVAGTIREVLDAGHYTYAQLATPSGPRWVVVMGALELESGDAAAFDVLHQRADFRSRRLERDFDLLLFARLDRDA